MSSKPKPKPKPKPKLKPKLKPKQTTKPIVRKKPNINSLVKKCIPKISSRNTIGSVNDIGKIYMSEDGILQYDKKYRGRIYRITIPSHPIYRNINSVRTKWNKIISLPVEDFNALRKSKNLRKLSKFDFRWNNIYTFLKNLTYELRGLLVLYNTPVVYQNSEISKYYAKKHKNNKPYMAYSLESMESSISTITLELRHNLNANQLGLFKKEADKMVGLPAKSSFTISPDKIIIDIRMA